VNKTAILLGRSGNQRKIFGEDLGKASLHPWADAE